jgi:hypothetical protein
MPFQNCCQDLKMFSKSLTKDFKGFSCGFAVLDVKLYGDKLLNFGNRTGDCT